VITIAGSTGRIGGLVARDLAARGMPLRLVVRDATRAPDLAQAEIRTADYADGEAVRQALDDAGTVLMVSSTEAPDRLDAHHTFVDAAAAAGVSHVVYTSFVSAAPRATLTLARRRSTSGRPDCRSPSCATTCMRTSSPECSARTACCADRRPTAG